MRLILAALAAALTLAACGSDDTTTTGAPASGGGAFPVTVEHKFGKTTIESEPQRVVTVGYTDQDAVLGLGVVPVAVGDYLGGYKWRERPWAQDALGGADPEVVSGEQVNFEAVAAARPDLIIGITAGLKQSDYDKLAQIAPTVAQSGDFIDFGMPWQEQTLLVGKALGRETQAKALVADVEADFAAARKEFPQLDGATGVLGYGGPDGYGAYATADTRSRFLTELGLQVPEQIDDLAGDSFYTPLSEEKLELLDRDLVLMYGTRDEVLSSPAFGRLDAVRDGHVVYVGGLTSDYSGALGFASALSMRWLIENEVPGLAAAVDGEA